jgi:hypothetical protein
MVGDGGAAQREIGSGLVKRSEERLFLFQRGSRPRRFGAGSGDSRFGSHRDYFATAAKAKLLGKGRAAVGYPAWSIARRLSPLRN